MASFKLDDIRAAADRKYGSTDIDLGNGRTLVMRNALRLDKKTRDQLTAMQESMEAKDADHVAILGECIRMVATHAPDADELLNLIDGDLAILMEIFESYTKGTEVGEA
jgi:hypothetical protein